MVIELLEEVEKLLEQVKDICENESKFNGFYLRNKLLKIKDETYVSNLDDKYKSRKIHWIVLCVKSDNVTHFDSLRDENIPKEITEIIGSKNIFRIQAYDSIMCWYFCIGFIDFMLKHKSFLGYTTYYTDIDFLKTKMKWMKK